MKPYRHIKTNTSEKEMKELGKSRTSKRRQSHIQRSEESVTSYGKVMVAQTIKPLASAINDYLKGQADKTGRPEIAYLRLCEVEPEISALITAKHIINTVTQQKPFTGTCIALGGKIETEVSLKNFKNLNPELYNTVKMDLDKKRQAGTMPIKEESFEKAPNVDTWSGLNGQDRQATRWHTPCRTYGRQHRLD